MSDEGYRGSRTPAGDDELARLAKRLVGPGGLMGARPDTPELDIEQARAMQGMAQVATGPPGTPFEMALQAYEGEYRVLLEGFAVLEKKLSSVLGEDEPSQPVADPDVPPVASKMGQWVVSRTHELHQLSVAVQNLISRIEV